MIRMFEEYNEYYTEIDEIEAHRKSLVPFSRIEIDSIKKMVSERTGFSIQLKERGEHGEVTFSGCSFILLISTNGYRFDINIRKNPDEWYIVYLPGQYYRCDQLDGLVRLIGDKD